MPDTGAPWNIPYVASSDLVKDWPTDNQTQAEAIADNLGIVAAVSTTLEGTFSTTATSYTAITGLSVSITPTSASNKILVLANVMASAYDTTNPTGRWANLTVYRNGTAMLSPTSPGSRNDGIAAFIDTLQNGNVLSPFSMVYLDSPATTSSTTYAVYGHKVGLATLYINRSNNDTDAAATIRGVSTITALEVKG